MKNFLIGVFATLATGALALAVLVYGGFVDIAADSPHSALVHSLLETARERALARNIGGLVPPPDLADAQRIRRGAGNYDAMCAGCHLAPGVADTEIRKGLYPQPPDLAQAATPPSPPARQFWIVKHGIKASGMSAWGRGGMGDADIWDLVALLQRLPALSPADYRAQVAASGGHSHAGQAAEAAPGEAHAHPGAAGHAHAPGKHRH